MLSSYWFFSKIHNALCCMIRLDLFSLIVMSMFSLKSIVFQNPNKIGLDKTEWSTGSHLDTATRVALLPPVVQPPTAGRV
mmetsp:Transcript_9296/g.19328  ORF Transcript_9296/g.19328 Transcript_9296/m.19328 type:complete len:80 (+) Transcript_9296:1334-1573(+)